MQKKKKTCNANTFVMYILYNKNVFLLLVFCILYTTMEIQYHCIKHTTKTYLCCIVDLRHIILWGHIFVDKMKSWFWCIYEPKNNGIVLFCPLTKWNHNFIGSKFEKTYASLHKQNDDHAPKSLSKHESWLLNGVWCKMRKGEGWGVMQDCLR